MTKGHLAQSARNSYESSPTDDEEIDGEYLQMRVCGNGLNVQSLHWAAGCARIQLRGIKYGKRSLWDLCYSEHHLIAGFVGCQVKFPLTD